MIVGSGRELSELELRLCLGVAAARELLVGVLIQCAVAEFIARNVLLLWEFKLGCLVVPLYIWERYPAVDVDAIANTWFYSLVN